MPCNRDLRSCPHLLLVLLSGADGIIIDTLDNGLTGVGGPVVGELSVRHLDVVVSILVNGGVGGNEEISLVALR